MMNGEKDILLSVDDLHIDYRVPRTSLYIPSTPPPHLINSPSTKRDSAGFNQPVVESSHSKLPRAKSANPDGTRSLWSGWFSGSGIKTAAAQSSSPSSPTSPTSSSSPASPRSSSGGEGKKNSPVPVHLLDENSNIVSVLSGGDMVSTHSANGVGPSGELSNSNPQLEPVRLINPMHPWTKRLQLKEKRLEMWESKLRKEDEQLQMREMEVERKLADLADREHRLRVSFIELRKKEAAANTLPPATQLDSGSTSLLLLDVDTNNGMWYDHLTNGHVLRMQKIVRHWLLVIRWRKLVQTAQSSSVTKGLRDRAKAIKEVVTSEERYLRDLMRLVEKYKLPIEEQGAITEHQSKEVFGNIEDILNFSMTFYSKLHERLASWPAQQFFGDIFTNDLGKAIPHYDDYVNNMDASTNTLITLKEDRLFVNLLDNIRVTYNISDISSYLITPVQRLPRYELLLKELLKNTPEDHVDYLVLTSSLKFVVEKITDINRKKKERDLLREFARIQSAQAANPIEKKILRKLTSMGHLPIRPAGPTKIVGKVKVHVKGAKGLRACRIVCVLECGDQILSTHPVRGPDPEWNEVFVLTMNNEQEVITIFCIASTKTEVLGQFQVLLTDIPPPKENSAPMIFYPLTTGYGTKVSGHLQVSLLYQKEA